MAESSSRVPDFLPPHVASLASSFAAVSPAAVPAIIDCVLASSALSPFPLFSSLLHAFPDLSQVLESNYIVSHAAALCHLIKKIGTPAPNDALRLLIWRMFVPLLEAINPNDSELLSQVDGLLCDVMSKMQYWELVGATLVPFCLRSVGLGMGMLHSEELTTFHWNSEGIIDQEFECMSSGVLPLPIACCILKSLLDTALRRRREFRSLEPKSVDVCNSLNGFVHNVTWDLSKMALRMLMQGPEYRSSSVRLLLPPVFSSLNELCSVMVSVHGSRHTLSRLLLLREIWKCCISLFSLGHLERIGAYHVLSLCFSFCHMECEDATGDNTGEEFDIRAMEEFWKEIRKGLVDKEVSVRKQALYILKISLSYYSSPLETEHNKCCSDDTGCNSKAKNALIISLAEAPSPIGTTKRGRWAHKEAKSLGVGEVCHLENYSLSSRERWKVFLLLYEMLEEYGTHLVEAAWTHQVSLLLLSRPLSSYLNHITCGIYQVQMETLEGIFSWLAILWERGFSHENPQVRCLILQSFLDIDWDKYGNSAHIVPRSFVLGPLICGLNDVVHHKDFGVKSVYNSKTIQGASKFFCSYSRQLKVSDRATLVWSLAAVTRQEAFGRAGLMALASCIASAACHSYTDNVNEVHHSVDGPLEVDQKKSAQEDLLPCSPADILDVLGIIIERSKQHFNPNYRLKVCEQVLKATLSLISITEVPLDLLLHFLSTVPREFTDHAGPLRRMVQQWLTQTNDKHSVDSEIHVLKNLISFPTSFIKHKQSPGTLVSFDDEDVNAWGAEARRWARILLLVITKEQQLEPILMFLRSFGSSLCKQDPNMEWVPIKLLILILNLVDEFQIVRKKLTCYTEAKSETESDMKNILHYESPLVTLFGEKSTKLFLILLEELLSFSKLMSQVFWSISVVKDTQLPSSVKGKLGGPSQRRLASLTTSAVLQAVLSMRAVACVSSWCNQLIKDRSLDSAFTFLWDFSWKVIKSPAYDSESGAEIRLAAYEALACVLKALSTYFNTSCLDFVMAYNESHFSSEEVKPLLDLLVLCFLHNINDLLAIGVLARSRRAVLMNWKWHCLDSLLSVPYIVTEKGVYLKDAYPLFSVSTLRSIFFDIVESLENAGESSVLSMLRSVRLVLGLLCCGRISSVFSSCSGVTCQMMLQLVQSSWVLHLSCNKRRVAPIAALLSAVLHRSVFGDLSMHEMNGSKPGPLKWFIEKLLDEGTKSPRTIRLAALHLTGLWLLYPRIIKYYIKELKLLTLYGSVAFDEDFEAEFSENHEARIEVSLLAQSPDCEFTELFVNTEMYARVSVAVLFYKLANLADRRGELENQDTLAALRCGKAFLLELLDSVVNDKDLAKELYKKYSGIHRRKVRAWQMICILSHFVEEDIVEEVTSNLHICLCRNNLPAVRQYLETFAIQIFLKFPLLAEEQLIPIFHNYKMRPQALASYVFITANVILHANELSLQIKHLNKLLPPIIPFLTSHHHSLRGFTQLLVHQVLCKLWPLLKSNSSEAVSLEKKCFEDLKSYLTENTDCVRLRTSMECFLDAYDPNTSTTPFGVFNAHREGSEFECAPTSLMEQVIGFLNDVRDDLRYSIAKDAAIIKNESLAVADACKDIKESLDDNTEQVSSQTFRDISLDFQKKITLQKLERQSMSTDTDCVMGDAEFLKQLLEMEKEDQLLSSVLQSRNQAVEQIRQSQQQFILVASLLDRIPNLAGLARTCEVFKAAGLAIADASILQDKQFQLISVTAEKWVPIIEVPICSIKAFLEKKRREGFSILGLEQTANSTPLDHFSFPTKTVLVLGREKEGIPVDIIHVLDACVEIPQLGIIRSLNVHVSGAIALWEYTRQQRSGHS
ncbi:uncharacterized protein LOC103710780 [Phoenix dactylifera]|uniref:tRNA (guanosine(18)-2'-O)-methyltransferase TARBP1 n=1 Tax=Phoenix dactylifera TaxID=42345 RepID=A0A8B8ZVV2_PHODC|nr:uncharacterized protein LOC103710780 [Phoenix dactylifera]